MARFSDWLSNSWNTTKSIAEKVCNFIGKAGPMFDSFIGNQRLSFGISEPL
jgi:hypothetical protein